MKIIKQTTIKKRKKKMIFFPINEKDRKKMPIFAALITTQIKVKKK